MQNKDGQKATLAIMKNVSGPVVTLKSDFSREHFSPTWVISMFIFVHTLISIKVTQTPLLQGVAAAHISLIQPICVTHHDDVLSIWMHLDNTALARRVYYSGSCCAMKAVSSLRSTGRLSSLVLRPYKCVCLCCFTDFNVKVNTCTRACRSEAYANI